MMPHSLSRLWEICHASGYIRWQLEMVKGFTGAEGASLLLHDPGSDQLVFAVSTGLNADRLTGGGHFESAARTPLDPSLGINSMALLFGKPMCMQRPDARHDPTVDQSFGQRTHSVFAIPITARERPLGTVSVINAHASGVGAGQQYQFLPEDCEAAEQAAEAIRLWIANRLEGTRLEQDFPAT